MKKFVLMLVLITIAGFAARKIRATS